MENGKVNGTKLILGLGLKCKFKKIKPGFVKSSTKNVHQEMVDFSP